MANQNALWARYLNYKIGFSKSANDYMTAYTNCGLDSGAAINLVVTDRNGQPPTGAMNPLMYRADSSVSFEMEYKSQPSDEFETQLSGLVTLSNNALCALDKPVTFVPLDTAVTNPCQSVQDQANFIGALLFQKLKDSLTVNFDSLYRAKCLSAQSMEVFYATYVPSEYHYTLCHLFGCSPEELSGDVVRYRLYMVGKHIAALS